MTAFVVFNVQEGKERVSKYFQAERNIFGYVNRNKHNQYLHILNEDMEVIGEIPEPSNIIWKNLHNEPWVLFRNKIIAFSVITAILWGILLIFINYHIFLASYIKKYDIPVDCTNYSEENISLDLAKEDKVMTMKNHGIGVYTCFCKMNR